MPERSVTVRISATDSFSTVVDNYKAKMGQAKTSTDNMNTASNTGKQRMDALTGAVGGFIAGIGVQKVLSFAGEMQQLGTEVNLTKQRFEALTTPMGEAEAIIQRLRTASMGTATDQTLMEGSNLLMMTGVADSPEELEEIIGLISRTKQPTEDLGDAINNFSLMLTNQSLLRLDSFGISSGRVRARILELLDAGEALNREDAFRMAVMEEGAKLIDRLGDSATSAATPLARLAVNAENLKNSFAGNFATGVEGVVGIAEIALGQHPEQIRQAEEAANLFAEDLQTAIEYAMADAAVQGEDQSFVTDFLSRAIRKAQADPSLAADATALRDAVLADFGVFYPEAALGPEGGLHDQAQQINMMSIAAQQAITGNQIMRESVALQAEQAAEAERVADAQSTVRLLQYDINQLYQQGADTWAQMAAVSEQFGQKDELIGDLEYMSEVAGNIQIGEFGSREDANRLASLADAANETLEQMKELDAANDAVFSDSELEIAQGQADAIGEMADEAERAAKALENIKLSDIFGTSGGGVTGEISDLLIKQLQANGAEPEQIAAVQRELDLQSGRETEGSLALKENLVPQIAGLVDDPELMAEMAGAIGKVLVGAAQQGVDTNDPAFIQQLMGNIETEGEDFDPDAFVNNFADLETSASAVQTSITTFFNDITSAQEPVGIVETALGNMSTFASNINDRFKELTSKVQVIKARIDVEVTGDDIDGLISNAVRNNGGKVPGAVM